MDAGTRGSLKPRAPARLSRQRRSEHRPRWYSSELGLQSRRLRLLPYQICDVFTDRPLAGNALAVFTDCAGLDVATMQSLARETNLSESAFVLPPSSSEADARIRIFTPTVELPFAGHPTLGSAFVLAGGLRRDVIRLEMAKGVITVRLRCRARAFCRAGSRRLEIAGRALRQRPPLRVRRTRVRRGGESLAS
jgi:hypothetical protein